MRVGLPHLGQSVLFEVPITYDLLSLQSWPFFFNLLPKILPPVIWLEMTVPE